MAFNKDLILETCAFTVAALSAVASAFSPEHVYVRAKRTATSAAQCVKTDKTCDPTGSGPCRIQISTSSEIQLADSDGTHAGGFITYNVGCAQVLRDSYHLQYATTDYPIYSLTLEAP